MSVSGSAGLFGYLLVGAIAGWVSGRMMKTGHLVLTDAGVGALGAVTARYLLGAVVDTAFCGWWLIATVGAAIPLAIARLSGSR